MGVIGYGKIVNELLLEECNITLLQSQNVSSKSKVLDKYKLRRLLTSVKTWRNHNSHANVGTYNSEAKCSPYGSKANSKSK